MAAKKKDTVSEQEIRDTVPVNDTNTVPETAEKTVPEEPETFVLTADEFHTVHAKIADLTREKDDTIALLQRNQADFENFRRRNAQVRRDGYDDGKKDCITELLAVMDDFDRVVESGSGESALFDGVKLIQKKLHATMEKLGLVEIDVSGVFDANLHNAVMSEKAEGKKPGEILAVLQKGYRLGDRIIRYAMVKVAE